MAARGFLTFRSYDEALFERLNCERVEVKRGEETIHVLCVNVPGVVGNRVFRGLVPVVFDSPEDTEADYRLPCFAIVPSGIEADTGRMSGRVPYVSRVPADGATAKTVVRRDGEVETGYSAYTEIPAPQPYNLSFDLKARARKRSDERSMLMHLLKRFPKNMGLIYAKDTLGVESSFTVFHEGVSETSDIADVTERFIECSVSIRIEAEIDLVDETTETSVFAGAVLSFDQMEGI